MINIKKEIAEKIAGIVKMESVALENWIETPPDDKMGDYSFPCFRLAKELKKAPQKIAEEMAEQIQLTADDGIEKVEVIGGYVNFFVKPDKLVSNVLAEIETKQENYGKEQIGAGKTVVIDYSSPNIAKPFHIGHLRSTVIGGALYNVYQALGYRTVGVNHLGDYGTQFGKIIEGYKRWHDEYDIDANPIDELTKIYVRINELCKEDESVLEMCRENFRKLEQGDPYCTELWNRFKDVSLKEFQKVYDLLGSKFDSWNGEAFYTDKTAEVIDILEKSGKLVESEGARIVDLSELDMAPCIIEKANGSTIYATRDLAAILYRARTYDFDKCLYVVAYEQNLHFRQIFEVAKYLGIDEKYTKGLEHVPFGMVRLKTGKMSTREGNVIKLEEILKEAIKRASSIIEEKNPNLENKEDVAKKVGIGAIIFNDLANSRVKDEIFDWDTILNFQGETGPYIQYIFVRTKSVLEKAGYLPKVQDLDVSVLTDEYSQKVIKLLYHYQETLEQVADKNEPSILSRYLIELAKSYSVFYNENKIIVEDKKVQDARLYLTYAVGVVLESGAKLLGIQMPDKM